VSGRVPVDRDDPVHRHHTGASGGAAGAACGRLGGGMKHRLRRMVCSCRWWSGWWHHARAYLALPGVYHAYEYLWSVGNAVFGAEKAVAVAWVEPLKTRPYAKGAASLSTALVTLAQTKCPRPAGVLVCHNQRRAWSIPLSWSRRAPRRLACAGAAPARNTSSRCAARAAGTLSGRPGRNAPAAPPAVPRQMPPLHSRLGHFALPLLIYGGARPSDGPVRHDQRHPLSRGAPGDRAIVQSLAARERIVDNEIIVGTISGLGAELSILVSQEWHAEML